MARRVYGGKTPYSMPWAKFIQELGGVVATGQYGSRNMRNWEVIEGRDFSP